jgi:inosine triphosphate pyrophosphatase
MEIYFITGNANKFREAKEILNLDIKQLDLDLREIQELDPQKIIEEKLKEAIKHHNGKFIVEDTSLHLDGLNGLPGPLIKWFLNAIGLQGIYELARNSGNTRAKAVTMIGYYNGKDIQFVNGITLGEIVLPSGKSTFGWDPIFKPNGCNKTYEEMTSEEKNEISHRGKAFLKLKKILGH